MPASAEPDRKPGRTRVLLVGDSGIVGRAVPEADRLHVRLRDELGRAGVEAEVLNAGVQGYSTDQVLLQMKRIVPQYRPDLVIYGLDANDLGGIASGTGYGLSKPRYVLEDGQLVVTISVKIS